MKKLWWLIALVAGILLLIAGHVLTARAQTKSPTPDTSVAIKAEEVLKVRNLQLEQAKRVIRAQQLQAEFAALQKEQEEIVRQINDWIAAQAKAQNVDLTKFQFDFDQLKFVERPPQLPK